MGNSYLPPSHLEFYCVNSRGCFLHRSTFTRVLFQRKLVTFTSNKELLFQRDQYLRRHHPPPEIPAIAHFLQVKQPCENTNRAWVLAEYLPKRLTGFQFSDQEQTVYLMYKTLRAYQVLQQVHPGSVFDVEEGQISIAQNQDEVKVWINRNYQLNEPFFLSFSSKLPSQSTRVQQIISLFRERAGAFSAKFEARLDKLKHPYSYRRVLKEILDYVKKEQQQTRQVEQFPKRQKAVSLTHKSGESRASTTDTSNQSPKRTVSVSRGNILVKTHSPGPFQLNKSDRKQQRMQPQQPRQGIYVPTYSKPISVVPQQSPAISFQQLKRQQASQLTFKKNLLNIPSIHQKSKQYLPPKPMPRLQPIMVRQRQLKRGSPLADQIRIPSEEGEVVYLQTANFKGRVEGSEPRPELNVVLNQFSSDAF